MTMQTLVACGVMPSADDQSVIECDKTARGAHGGVRGQCVWGRGASAHQRSIAIFVQVLLTLLHIGG